MAVFKKVQNVEQNKFGYKVHKNKRLFAVVHYETDADGIPTAGDYCTISEDDWPVFDSIHEAKEYISDCADEYKSEMDGVDGYEEEEDQVDLIEAPNNVFVAIGATSFHAIWQIVELPVFQP